MAQADISALGNLQPIEPLDLDEYVDNQDYPPPPVKGKYTVRAPENFLFSRTQKGALSAQVDPTIVGSPYDGYLLKFTKVSGKTFQRSGANVSQIGDYLRACGIKGKVTSEEDQIELVERTANTVYQVEVDWRVYHKSGFKLEGMENFPKDGNGGYQPWCEHPTEKDDTGAPIRLRANATVKRMISMTV